MSTTKEQQFSSSSTAIRVEPVQARSAARVNALLDAACATMHEFGYEQLTTAMVAEKAGASIGTVYRYFPDRVAVLQAVAARNLERTLESWVSGFAPMPLPRSPALWRLLSMRLLRYSATSLDSAPCVWAMFWTSARLRALEGETPKLRESSATMPSSERDFAWILMPGWPSNPLSMSSTRYWGERF
jgi:AcrR family transcriptional regulator